MPKPSFKPGDEFTLVHAADLHLGSGMAVARRLGREDDLRSATYDALDNLRDVVEREDARLLTLAGDLFDDADLYNPVPRRHLRKVVEALPNVGVAVVRGNHDYHHRQAPPLGLGENTCEFKGNIKTWDLGWVRVHGISYTSQRQAESLLPRYPEASAEHLDIGLLHANVGSNPDHASYAPCTKDELAEHGYDMWFLGHIHKRQILSDDPLIIYPGNTQGRHAGETGPRSVEVVHVRDGFQHEAVPVHSVLWEQMEVDVSGCERDDDVLDLVERTVRARRDALTNERGLILRVTLTGQTGLHERLSHTPKPGEPSFTDDVASVIHDAYAESDPFVLADRVRVRTRSTFDLEAIAGDPNIMGVLARAAGDDYVRSTALTLLKEDGLLEDGEAVAVLEELWDDAVQGALGRIRGRRSD